VAYLYRLSPSLLPPPARVSLSLRARALTQEFAREEDRVQVGKGEEEEPGPTRGGREGGGEESLPPRQVAYLYRLSPSLLPPPALVSLSLRACALTQEFAREEDRVQVEEEEPGPTRGGRGGGREERKHFLASRPGSVRPAQ